ncbi:hypothetical protein JTE90_000906 [Oedothorax gibbosus]|uniref:PARG helical domain-containing protein n=1 Tax=Oedothorax gibbosus TaxID=931172 RepID=A0AAV6VT27_9ARAC|nr:hypothetical protein JTE90_000906 [Oedothorax gibbosus]
MENLGKTRIASPGRSQGDGMENTPYTEVDSPKIWGSVHGASPKSPGDYYHKHFVPTQGKTKGPKFVPYEPYKAAVSPIVPTVQEKEQDTFSSPQSQFVIDSQRVSSLASSIIKMYSNMEKTSEGEAKSEECSQCHPDCSERLKSLEDKIATLEKEKKELMSQYLVQTEVNADLKKMLVASLGEDVQLKVHLMTEDKAALGKEVLRLAEQVETLTEEAERKAVSCDVWESKFKASSLMVKELAHWKSTLSQLVNQSATSLGGIMHEHEKLYEMLLTSHSKLESCVAATNSKTILKKNLQPKTLPQLAMEMASLSNKVQERFLGRLFSDVKPKYQKKLTKEEDLANQFLKSFENLGTGLPASTNGTISCKDLSHVCTMDASANFCKHCSAGTQPSYVPALKIPTHHISTLESEEARKPYDGISTRKFGMAHVLLPCDLPSWSSVQRHLALLKTCRDGKQLADAMNTIFDMCSVSLDPDDAALPLEGHPGIVELGRFVDEVLSETERGRFLKETIPKLATRAAELKRPSAGFLYSLRKEEGEFRVPRPLVSSLLANAFFSTFPKRNAKTHPTLQDFRMADFFALLMHKRSHQKKLKAFLRYFDNLDSHSASGDLKFTRKVVLGPSLPWWLCSDRPLVPLVLRQDGGVHDAEPNIYRACSCSPLIGGDVLKASTTKEARLFFSFPELLVLLSFVESLASEEAFVAENAGPQGLNLCFLDSSQFCGDRQFEDGFLLRELNKALVAFTHNKGTGDGLRRVSHSSNLPLKGQVSIGSEDSRPRSKTLHKWHSSQNSSKCSMRTASQSSVEPLLRREDDFYTADEESEEGSRNDEADVSRSDSMGFVLGASEDSSVHYPLHERLDDFRRRIRKRTRRRLSRRSSRSLTSSGSSDMEDISEDVLSEGISEEEDMEGSRLLRPASSEPSIVTAVENSSPLRKAPLSEVAELLTSRPGVSKKMLNVRSSNGRLKAYSYDGVSPNLPVPFKASFRRRKGRRPENDVEAAELLDDLPPSVSRQCSAEEVEEKVSSSGARAAAVEPLEESGADSQLRVTLLWLAASMADLHALILYTAGHPQMKEISKVYTKVLSREWTVGDLSCEVLRFCRNRLSSNSHASPQLFSQIIGRQASSSMSQESLD